jgi:hypothetical protein
MNTINETIELNADLLIEVDQPKGNQGPIRSTSWLDRFEDWLNFLKDVVKILAE